MYKEFKIKNFKCFSEFSIDNLERVNLIAGENNVGKTALLEALFLHCGGYNPNLLTSINSMRGINTLKTGIGKHDETPWNLNFHNLNIDSSILLSGTDNNKHRNLKISILREMNELADYFKFMRKSLGEFEMPPIPEGIIKILEFNGYEENSKPLKVWMTIGHEGYNTTPIPHTPIRANFLTTRARATENVAASYGELEVKGLQNTVKDVLLILEPRLKRLAVIPTGDTSIIYGDIGLPEMIPISAMGEGMSRLASIIVIIITVKDGVLIIDEIESGFHHSIMKKVWRAIGEAARKSNVQVFAATHSRECVVAAHQAFSENGKYDFRYHRLDKIKDKIKAVNYNQETLQAAIDANFEVR